MVVDRRSHARRAFGLGVLVVLLLAAPLVSAGPASANNAVAPYKVSFSPAAMWATGPICDPYQTNVSPPRCPYSDWRSESGHAVGENPLPPNVPGPGSKPLPKAIPSPSPTVEFTVPCYFIWDVGEYDEALDEASGSKERNVGDFIHCEARIYGVSGPATVTGTSPLVGSGWTLLASGEATVGPEGIGRNDGGVEVVEGGVEMLPDFVTCQGRTNDCVAYKKNITLRMFTPKIGTRLVFGTRYYEGDDRGIESQDQFGEYPAGVEQGFISGGNSPISLRGYSSWNAGNLEEPYFVSGANVNAETPTMQCLTPFEPSEPEFLFHQEPKGCSWENVSATEPVLCTSGLSWSPTLQEECTANDENPTRYVGFDMATGRFNATEQRSKARAFGWEEVPTLVVEPIAFLQTNILVTGVLYAPPGNLSTAGYAYKKSRSVQIGVGKEVTNSTLSSTSTSTTEGFSDEAKPEVEGIPIKFSFTGSEKHNWVKSILGTSSESTGESATITNITEHEWGLGAHKFLSSSWWGKHLGEADSWFLNDEIVVLKHPKWTIWDFTDPDASEENYTQQLIGSGGETLIPVHRLIEECIGWGHVQEKIVIPAVGEKYIELGRTECLELLRLDPFTEEFARGLLEHKPIYAAPGNEAPGLAFLGEGAPEPSRYDPLPLDRFLTLYEAFEVATEQQVEEATNENKLTISTSAKNVKETGYASSFESVVESVLTGNWSAGVTLPFGLGGVSLQNEDKTTNATKWKVNYKNSETNTEESVDSAKVKLEAEARKNGSEPETWFETLGFADATYGTLLFEPLSLAKEVVYGKGPMPLPHEEIPVRREERALERARVKEEAPVRQFNEESYRSEKAEIKAILKQEEKEEKESQRLAISSVSPDSGPTAGGTVITVEGSGFGVGDETRFLFGKEDALEVSCSSSTTCTMIAPPAAKAGKVEVLAEVGTKTSKSNPSTGSYTYT